MSEQAAQPEVDTLDTTGIALALRQRFRLADGYAVIEEVGNATGHRCNRHADAIVMNLWPSRGLEIMGFEFKASRSDWVKELKSPGKADPIFQYCDRWYLVAGSPSIVKDGELPPQWGLMLPQRCFEEKGRKGNNFTLRDKVAAAALQPKDLDRSFVAAMLRAAAKESVSEKRIQRAKDGEYARGYKNGEDQGKRSAGHDVEGFKRLQEQVQAFEKASGISISGYADGEKIGAMYKIAGQLVENGGWHSLERELERVDTAAKDLRHRARQIREEVRKHLRTKVSPELLPEPKPSPEIEDE